MDTDTILPDANLTIDLESVPNSIYLTIESVSVFGSNGHQISQAYKF